MLNLGKCLEDKLTLPAYKEEETRGDETARVKAEDERKKQRFMVWFKLVNCLDKASINFIRLHKPDGVEDNVHQHREAPHSDVAHSAGWLEVGTRGEVTDYLIRAEGIRLHLQEAGEMTSNAMFSAMLLKGLSSIF